MEAIDIRNLDEGFIPARKLLGKSDARYEEQSLLRFLGYNKYVLDWLGIEAYVANEGGVVGMHYTSSNYVGAAPLRHHQTGLYYTDITVTNRFQEDVVSLTELLEEYITPEFLDLDLRNAESVRAPIYFDCINYILAFPSAIESHWNKFHVEERLEAQPRSGTVWTKYAQRSYDPANALRYPNRRNTLHQNHTEWQQLCYVLTLAINELHSHRVPAVHRIRYWEQVSLMRQYLSTTGVMIRTDEFKISPSDPNRIKQLKRLANIILSNQRQNAKAWRIDSAELFERYIQYICTQIGRQVGASAMANPKFSIKGSPYMPAWSLRYLEPDAVITKDDMHIFVDAKYKSHMLNDSRTESLLESFRADLHQVLAYTSFGNSDSLYSWIFYPYKSSKNEDDGCATKIVRLSLDAPHNFKCNTVYLIGVSLDVADVPNIIRSVVSKCLCSE